jgi:plastocyanin
MNGQIHVLAPSQPLPHNQAFYDREAMDESDHLLSDIDHQAQDIDHRGDNEQGDPPSHRVIAGTGEIVGTGGGFQTAAVVRFFPETITVHVGQTVEWTNMDPMTNHSITFGVDPTPLRFPVPIVSSGVGVNQTLDSDGALHANVSFPSDNVHSGALWPLPADRAVQGPNAGLPTTDPPDLSQFPLPAVVQDLNQRYRVTFTHPGTFNYHCAYHDNLGMLGQVIVVP